jgi:peptidoglycan/LPS O-acetylase OafA/YrhL
VVRALHKARRRRLGVPLQQAFDSRRNSLSLLRLVFAAMVLFDHSFPLGGFNGGRDPMWGWTGGQESFGGIAVLGFFVISGFLVTRSFDDSPTPVSYIWKRVLRIFPGFWVCLLVTVVVFGPLAFVYEHGTLHQYVVGYSDNPLRYVKNNAFLSMNQYGIDGLLGSNPWPHAFDGSLWTLIYEFKCYLGVMVLGMIGVFRKWRESVIVLCLILWGIQLKQFTDPNFLKGWFLIGDSNMVRLAFVFSIGMIFYLFRDKIIISDLVAAVSVVVLLVSVREALFYGVGIIAFSYVCIWAAVRLPFHQIDRYGDFSYGLYIYAFPVEQLFALYHVNSWGLAPYVLLSLAGAMVLAVASWFAVERPFLRLKTVKIGRFRSAASAGDVIDEQSLAKHFATDPAKTVFEPPGGG